MNSLHWIKIALVERNKTIKALANSLGMSYSRISLILNGFTQVPRDFERNVTDALALWDNEEK
jgi:transcriptional regulator with XRE-family HTH domain